MIFFLSKHFYRNKYLLISLFVLLTFFPQYLKIWNGQYHFFLNTATFFLFYYIINQKSDTLRNGFLFLIATIPFLANHSGDYFVNNLVDRIKNPFWGPPRVFTIDALVRFYKFSFYNGFLTKGSITLLLYFLFTRYRISILWSLFTITSFYLLFYDLVFEYHYTILIPFLYWEF